MLFDHQSDYHIQTDLIIFLDNVHYHRRIFFFSFLEEMEMKIGSDNTSPVNQSTSTIDNQHDHQHLISRTQSLRTILTEVVA